MFKKRNPFSNSDGAILVEAAMFFPFLVITFFGIVEITQYIDSRERVDRMSNQLADYYGGLTANTTNIVGTIGSGSPEWPNVKNIMRDLAAPHSIAVDVTFCSPNSIFSNGVGFQNSFNLNYSGGGATPGVCGFGGAIPGYNMPVGICPPGFVIQCTNRAANGYCPGLQDLVIVRAGCNYSPMFNFLNLFPSGIAIQSVPLVIPLRVNNAP